MDGTLQPTDIDEVRRLDLDHHLHPFTDFATRGQGSMIVTEAEGVHVRDAEGRSYLDGIAGLWCVNVGYGRTEIAEAMAAQARTMCYYSSFGAHTSIPAARLAGKLAELAPAGLDHVFFGTGGSMSNDTAVRMIHFYFNRLGKPQKKKIITRHDGYHGSTYLSMSLTGVAYDHIGFDIVGEELIHRVSAPNLYRRPQGSTEEEYCDLLVEEFRAKVEALGADNVAAFFAEPIIGAGGVLMAPQGYHRRIKEICEASGILYVADEVVTAFGRLGHMIASEEVFGVVPDLITVAKGLTSAYAPLSASIFSEAVYDVISVPQAKGAMFTHGFTYSGHPVCTAAALANIAILEREDICGHVRKVGPYFENALKGLADLPIVGDVRGSHFMMCLENVAVRETKRPFDPEVAIGRRISTAAQSRGLLVRPVGHMNILSPPLILTIEQIDWLVATLREAILEVCDGLVAEGHRLT